MTDAVVFAGYSRAAIGVKPAGAHIIANVFRRAGLTAVVIDMCTVLTREQRQKLLRSHVTPYTKFVCLSTTLFGLAGDMVTEIEEVDASMTTMFGTLRRRAPAATFIIGGSKVTAGDRTTMDFDYGVIGQGETTLLAIVNHVLYGDPLVTDFTVNNVRYVSDKTYPYGTYNTDDLLEFTADDGVAPGETLPLEFGRGCVFKCSYCMYALTGKEFGDYTKPAKLLADAMRRNYERFGTTRYVLTDDTVNDSLEKARVWETAVSMLDFPVEFGGYMRLELFHKYPELIELYARTGLRAVNFGVETFNKVAGSAVGKGFGERGRDTLLALRAAWGDNVHVSTNFIIGLPTETEEQIRADAEWLRRTRACHSATYYKLLVARDRSQQGFGPEYAGYYRETDEPLPPQLDWTAYLRRYINWKSPCMSLAQAHRLQVDLNTKWENWRWSLDATVSAFGFMALRRWYSQHELTHSTRVGYAEHLREIAELRRDTYAALMAEVPSTRGNPIRVTPKIVPASSLAFVNKWDKRKV